MKNFKIITQDLIERGYSFIELSNDLYERIISTTNCFFHSDIEIKYNLLADLKSGILGYSPSKFELETNPIQEFTGNKRRVFSSFYFINDNSSILGKTPLLKVNKWSAQLESFQFEANLIYREISLISIDITTHLFQQYQNSSFNTISQNNCLSLMRLIDYLPTHKEYLSKEHTDPELISIIVTNEEGLEITNRCKDWEKVIYKPNQAIIIAGDLLEFISKGDIQATKHRINVSNKHKQSTIFFQGLPLDYPVEIGNKICTFGEYILPILLKGSPHLLNKIE